ncbi:phage regulatory CII family protein [Pantoea sp. UBA6567]|uniref:phage regulatory CII family protein n=1 Tax=Pantoea sp. UBA6567 TaxID=1947043 RepID=UPI00259548B7|nr:phage regulatory CII family protein [Pantoea sp. UBA6567]
MFDFKVSTHSHFDEACRKFALTHNMTELAQQADMKVQTLRNKLNPDQVHQLSVAEMLLLTDLTEDATLIDGALAQLQCLPCVPVNEVADEKYSAYVLKATAEVGMLAAKAASAEKITATCCRGVVEAANTGIRCLMLAAIAVQSRIHSNPTLASTVDAISGLSASVGLN